MGEDQSRALLGSSASAQQSVSPLAGALKTVVLFTKQLIVANAHELNDRPIARAVNANRRLICVATGVGIAPADCPRRAADLPCLVLTKRVNMAACPPVTVDFLARSFQSDDLAPTSDIVIYFSQAVDPSLPAHLSHRHRIRRHQLAYALFSELFTVLSHSLLTCRTLSFYFPTKQTRQLS